MLLTNKQFLIVLKRAHDQCSILVRFSNFALTTGFYWSCTLFLKLHIFMRSCTLYITTATLYNNLHTACGINDLPYQHVVNFINSILKFLLVALCVMAVHLSVQQQM